MKTKNIYYLAVFKKTDIYRRTPYFLRWDADEKLQAYVIKLEPTVTDHIMIQFAQEDYAKRWFNRFIESEEYRWFLDHYSNEYACNFLQLYVCKPSKASCFSVNSSIKS